MGKEKKMLKRIRRMVEKLSHQFKRTRKVFSFICLTVLFCSALSNNATGMNLEGLSLDSGYYSTSIKEITSNDVDDVTDNEFSQCGWDALEGGLARVMTSTWEKTDKFNFLPSGVEWCPEVSYSETNISILIADLSIHGYFPDQCYFSSCTPAGVTYNSSWGCFRATWGLNPELIAGSVQSTTTSSPGCYGGANSAEWHCMDIYNWCNMQPLVGTRSLISSGKSSYTFKTECRGEQARKVTLQITGKLSMSSETKIHNTDFLINGQAPTAIYSENAGYDSSSHIYNWNGQVRWDVHIPESKRCGDKVIVTPSSAHGYGELNIDEIKAVYEDCNLSSISISPSEVRPAKIGDESLTKAVIGISLTSPAPSAGCVVKLRVEPVEGTGGHNHVGNRAAHTGTVDQNSVVFVPGESILANAAVYTGGEVAGQEKIIAELLDNNGFVISTKSVSVDVKVPDLRLLGGSEYYTLEGSTSNHVSNHYGLFWTNWMIDFVANDYFDETETMLQINDMSLEGGGLFDICGTWDPSGTCSNAPKGGHKMHRKGTSVDINGTAYKQGKYVLVDLRTLKRIAESNGGMRIPEGTIHYEFQ